MSAAPQAGRRTRVALVAMSIGAAGVVGSLSLGLAAGCSKPASPSAAAVLETMRQLTVARVLTREAVQQALEAELGVEGSNDRVTYFKGRPRP